MPAEKTISSIGVNQKTKTRFLQQFPNGDTRPSTNTTAGKDLLIQVCFK